MLPKILTSIRLVAVTIALGYFPDIGMAQLRVVANDGTETLVTSDRMRITVGDKRGWQTGLDARHGELWIADSGRRMYWEGPIDEYCRHVNRTIERAVSLLRGQLERSSARGRSEREIERIREQLRLAEEQLRSPRRQNSQVSLEPTDERTVIADHETQRFRVIADGGQVQDVWVTTDPVIAREIDLQSWARFSGLWSCVGIGVQAGAPDARLKLLDVGWPLKWVTHAATPADTDQIYEAATIERRPLPASEFRPPPNYEKATIEELLGGAH